MTYWAMGEIQMMTLRRQMAPREQEILDTIAKQIVFRCSRIQKWDADKLGPRPNLQEVRRRLRLVRPDEKRSWYLWLSRLDRNDSRSPGGPVFALLRFSRDASSQNDLLIIASRLTYQGRDLWTVKHMLKAQALDYPNYERAWLAGQIKTMSHPYQDWLQRIGAW